MFEGEQPSDKSESHLSGLSASSPVTILLTENTSFLNTPGCRNLKGSLTPVKAYPATVDKFASMFRPSVFCTERDNFFNVAKEKKKRKKCPAMKMWNSLSIYELHLCIEREKLVCTCKISLRVNNC